MARPHRIVLIARLTAAHLILGQVTVEQKSHEITVIPASLQLLELSGSVVTIGALGIQQEMAQTMRDQGADEVWGLNGHQGTPQEDVALLSEGRTLSHIAIAPWGTSPTRRTTQAMVRSFLGRFVRIGTTPRIEVIRAVKEHRNAPLHTGEGRQMIPPPVAFADEGQHQVLKGLQEAFRRRVSGRPHRVPDVQPGPHGLGRSPALAYAKLQLRQNP
jgi:hypothetical protein